MKSMFNVRVISGVGAAALAFASPAFAQADILEPEVSGPSIDEALTCSALSNHLAVNSEDDGETSAEDLADFERSATQLAAYIRDNSDYDEAELTDLLGGAQEEIGDMFDRVDGGDEDALDDLINLATKCGELEVDNEEILAQYAE